MNNRELLDRIRFFREKSYTDKLIIFVGSGVSCNVANMPVWDTLIKKMAEAIKYTRCIDCKKKSKRCQETCKFKDSFSVDEYLKIPQYVYNKNKRLYEQVLKDNIQYCPNMDAPLSKAILDLTPAHIITTNFDKLIENCTSIQRDNYEVIISDKNLLEAKKNRYILNFYANMLTT